MDMDLFMGGISSNKGQEAMESWLNETLFPKMMICEEEIKANYSILPQSSKQSKVRKQRKKRKKQHLHRNLKVTIDNFSSEGECVNKQRHICIMIKVAFQFLSTCRKRFKHVS